MAIRNIVTQGNDILAKKCRVVTEFNDRLHVLLDDMARNTGKDWELSEEYRAILIEAVGNAIKNPYDILPTKFAE